MKLNKNLVLVGMMSSGKSTIGRLLAKRLNLRFIDIDSCVESETNMKIIEIFKKKGEAAFRDLEEKITLECLDKINCIIALGGGGFINNKIRKEVQKKGISIWLDWNNKTIINRIRKNKKRPIALKLDNQKLKDLMYKRSKIYSKSDFKINCEKMNKLEIINNIIGKINR
tara:strand:+ start:609 stop:1118 length:510 start_codon:yes stop_codon:yes gene_type:complete